MGWIDPHKVVFGGAFLGKRMMRRLSESGARLIAYGVVPIPVLNKVSALELSQSQLSHLIDKGKLQTVKGIGPYWEQRILQSYTMDGAEFLEIVKRRGEQDGA